MKQFVRAMRRTRKRGMSARAVGDAAAVVVGAADAAMIVRSKVAHGVRAMIGHAWSERASRLRMISATIR
jgi:hypothetical protein